MLCLSEMDIPNDKYYILDTDDGVVTVVSRNGLNKVVGLGLTVAGVETAVDGGRIYAVDIHPVSRDFINQHTQRNDSTVRKDRLEILKRIYQDVLHERSLCAYSRDCRLCEDSNRIEARFLTGDRNWYSEEQELEFGHTEDICDADSIRPEGRKILQEFCKKMNERYRQYGVEVEWILDSEKAWSSFYVYFG